MRALALHEDALLVESAVWRTNALVLRSDDEAFLIDSPVLPDELTMLPQLFDEAGFPVCGLLATHGDWDHLLGRLAFPDLAMAVCETTAARLAAEPGVAARKLREFDGSWYTGREGALSLGGIDTLPVPGRLELGSREIELHPAEGHTADGMALLADWCGVLAVGDYISPVEIPMLSPGGSLSAYRATLQRLEPLITRVDHVVPGHGEVLDAVRAKALLAEDLTYLDMLAERGAEAELPLARRSDAQKRIHLENAALLDA